MKINLLDVNQLDEAITRLQSHSKTTKEKLQAVMEELQQIGLEASIRAYESAPYAGTKDVVISSDGIKDEDGKITFTIKAEGDATLFIEFGTGVRNSGAPSEAYGLVDTSISSHGTYGLGHGGNEKGWFYKGDVGDNPPTGTEYSTVAQGLVHTYGNPATPFMYEGRKAIEQQIEDVIRKHFKG